MAKYIDWYLVELEGLLLGRLRPDKVHEILTQAEAHLTDSRDELLASGMESNEAELASLARFGRARSIAASALASANHHGSGLWPAVALLCFTVVMFAGIASLIVGNNSGDMNVITDWFSAATGVFCLGSFLGRRLIWRSLLVLAVGLLFAGCCLCGFLFQGGGHFVFRGDGHWLRERTQAQITAYIQAKKDFDQVKLANSHFTSWVTVGGRAAAWEYPSRPWSTIDESQVIPSRSWVFHVRNPWEKTPDPGVAAAKWSENGEGLELHLNSRLKELTRELVPLEEGQSDSVAASAISCVPLLSAWTAVLLGMALGLNAVFASIGQRFLGLVGSRFRRTYV